MADAPRTFDAFSIPDRSAWRRLVDSGLRGGSFEALRWAFDPDTTLDPLVTQDDVAGLPHLQPSARPWLGGRAGWTARELIVEPVPRDAARTACDAIADGVDEVELCLDQLVADAIEPSADEPPGVSGVAVHCYEDFSRALDGVAVDSNRIGISAGEGSLAVLGYLQCLTKERGIDPSKIQADLDFDPVARLTQRQARFDDADDSVVIASRTGPDTVLDETTAMIRGCAEVLPQVRPLVIDGQSFHLSGADPSLEVGATLAALVQTARGVQARGVSFDAFAAATTLRVQVSHELLTEIAKLRALRLLWAKVAHAFDAQDAALHPNLIAITSGRSRAFRYDLRTNLLRTALASFAAVVGGCDTLICLPFDEDPAQQNDSTRRLARHQHHLLRDESKLADITDPAGGAYPIERLTHAIAAGAWKRLREIEASGGLFAAIEDGSLQAMHEVAAASRVESVARRSRTVVGINRYADPELESTEQAAAAASRTEAAWTERIESLAATAQARADGRSPEDQHGVSEACRALRSSASPGDLLTTAAAAASLGASTAEISTATWPDVDVVHRHRFAPLAVPDGEEFEELRDTIGPENLTAQIVTLGSSRSARRRADLARSVFRATGWRIEEHDTMDTAQGGGQAITVLCAEDDDATRTALPAQSRGFVIVVDDASFSGAGEATLLHDGCDLIEFFTTVTGARDAS